MSLTAQQILYAGRWAVTDFDPTGINGLVRPVWSRGQTPDGRHNTIELGSSQASGSSDTFTYQPNGALPKLYVAVYLWQLYGGSSPSLTVSLDRLTPAGWTSVWSSGAITSPGPWPGGNASGDTETPPGVHLTAGGTFRLSWTVSGSPSLVLFTPAVAGSVGPMG